MTVCESKEDKKRGRRLGHSATSVIVPNIQIDSTMIVNRSWIG